MTPSPTPRTEEELREEIAAKLALAMSLARDAGCVAYIAKQEFEDAAARCKGHLERAAELAGQLDEMKGTG